MINKRLKLRIAYCVLRIAYYVWHIPYSVFHIPCYPEAFRNNNLRLFSLKVGATLTPLPARENGVQSLLCLW